MKTLPLEETIISKIVVLRNQKVMIDADLSELHGKETKRLNEQVKRNIHRFSADFMFQLTLEEKTKVVVNCDHLQNESFKMDHGS
jgi:ORF6N domain